MAPGTAVAPGTTPSASSLSLSSAGGSIRSTDSMKVFQIPAGNVPPATGSPWNSVFIGWNFFG